MDELIDGIERAENGEKCELMCSLFWIFQKTSEYRRSWTDRTKKEEHRYEENMEGNRVE